MTRDVTRTAVLTALALVAARSAPLAAAPGDAKASFAAPCKYPSGMATDGRHLYIADWREAMIHQVGLETGEPVRVWAAPTLKPSGLAWVAGRLYVCDDHTGGVFAVDPETGVVETMFQAPSSRAYGLAWADNVLFILTRNKVYRVLPDDGTILGYFDVPARGCRHLTHDGRHLWVTDRTKDEFYVVEPEKGQVVTILAAPGPYPAGIAWLDGYLWNVDFQERTVRQLTVVNEPMYRLSDTRRARVEHLWSLANYGPGEVTDLVINLAVPGELPNQKLLGPVDYSTPPSSTARDRWDQPCAVFSFGGVPAGRKATLTYSVPVEVSAIRYLILPHRCGTLDDIPADIRARYTVDGSRYRITSPYIQETVARIVGDERNPYWIARRIYDFVIDRLEYEMVGGWDVPEVVLQRGSGSCSEYTFSFVALCRAAGLPARYQGSLVVRGDDASVDEAFHRWAQIYLPGYGWVPVDANHGDAQAPADQARGFGQLSNRFLITTHGGGDSEYLNWGYNAFAEYRTTGFCKIDETHFGFWEPLPEGGTPPAE